MVLHGRGFNFANFSNGDDGTRNARTTTSENSVSGSFGTFAAHDGVTVTIRSYDAAVQVNGAKMVAA